MQYWLNESTGILATCEQLGVDGIPIAGQEQVGVDDPRVIAIISKPTPNISKPSELNLLRSALVDLANGDPTAAKALTEKSNV